jgi:hypothetical protein
MAGTFGKVVLNNVRADNQHQPMLARISQKWKNGFPFLGKYASDKTLKDGQRIPLVLNGAGETTLQGVCIGVCSQKVRAGNPYKMGVSRIFWRTLSPPPHQNHLVPGAADRPETRPFSCFSADGEIPSVIQNGLE